MIFVDTLFRSRFASPALSRIAIFSSVFDQSRSQIIQWFHLKYFYPISVLKIHFCFIFWEFNKIIFSSNFTISHWANFQVDAQSSAYDWLMLFRHYFYQLWAPPSKHLFENPFSKVLWMYLILDPYRWLLEWITRYADGICYLFLRFLEKIPRLYRKWKWHIFATSCNIIMVKGLKLTKTR